MTSPDVLRTVVAGLAALTAGSTLFVLLLYLRQTWRLGRRPGAILARHVAEVSAGATCLIIGNGVAIYESIGATTGPPPWRLTLYLVGMLLLLSGVIEVGRLQRDRRRRAREPAGRHRPRA